MRQHKGFSILMALMLILSMIPQGASNVFAAQGGSMPNTAEAAPADDKNDTSAGTQEMAAGQDDQALNPQSQAAPAGEAAADMDETAADQKAANAPDGTDAANENAASGDGTPKADAEGTDPASSQKPAEDPAKKSGEDPADTPAEADQTLVGEGGVKDAEALKSALLEGSAMLGTDITLTDKEAITLTGGSAVLDLNGYVLILEGAPITLTGGASLTVTDSAPRGGTTRFTADMASLTEGKVKTEKQPYAGGMITAKNTTAFKADGKSTLTLEGGALYSCGAEDKDGGAVYLEDSTLVLKGSALIAASKAKRGGAVFADKNAQVLISENACIAENTAKEAGGGIYAAGGSTVKMDGGTICCNTAKLPETEEVSSAPLVGAGSLAEKTAFGGGIYAGGSKTTFRMTGGALLANSADAGAGAAVCDGALGQIFNTEINENTAGGFGGGIAGGDLFSFAENACLIYSNTAEGKELFGDDADTYQDKMLTEGRKDINGDAASDVFGMKTTRLANKLSDGFENWAGLLDGQALSFMCESEKAAEANYLAVLKAAPSEKTGETGEKKAGGSIAGNTASVHGGGLYAEGTLLLGTPSDIVSDARLLVTGYKRITAENGAAGSSDYAPYAFEILNASGEVLETVHTAKPNEPAFYAALPFASGTEDASQTVYYLKEKAESQAGWRYDETAYRITIDGGKQTETDKVTDADGAEKEIKRTTAAIAKVTVEAGALSGSTFTASRLLAADTDYTLSSAGGGEDARLVIGTAETGTFTNTYFGAGTLKISKQFVWDGTEKTLSEKDLKGFVFTITDAEGIEVAEVDYTAFTDGVYTLAGLKPGTYVVTETVPEIEGVTNRKTVYTVGTEESEKAGEAAVTDGGTTEVAIVNTMAVQKGTLVLTKKFVTVNATKLTEDYRSRVQFVITYPDGKQETKDLNAFTLDKETRLFTLTLDNLDEGSYQIEEKNNLKVRGYDCTVTWNIDNGEFFIIGGRTTGVMATNTYKKRDTGSSSTSGGSSSGSNWSGSSGGSSSGSSWGGSSGSSSSSSSGSSSGRGGSAKTGDTAPILPYAALAVISAAVFLAALLKRRHTES